MRTRFAPSPTGDLHLGGAWTALAAWVLARREGGRTVLRVEDIDPPRVVAGSAARILDDLEWLGFDWDEGPITQSSRSAIYEQALHELDAQGLTYPCDCSRAEIARVASAPHGDEGRDAVYPGTCRDAPRDREMKRPPAIRLRVPDDDRSRVRFVDLVCGSIDENVQAAVGDFVLRRGDGVFAYQLAVAVDDAAMGISHVVRADDLLSSTARQLLLMRLLGYVDTPRYAHVPLVVASDGSRLAKRTRGAIVRDLRDRFSFEQVLGMLGYGLGLVSDDRPRTAPEIAALARPPAEWRTTPWPIPASLADG